MYIDVFHECTLVLLFTMIFSFERHNSFVQNIRQTDGEVARKDRLKQKAGWNTGSNRRNAGKQLSSVATRHAALIPFAFWQTEISDFFSGRRQGYKAQNDVSRHASAYLVAGFVSHLRHLGVTRELFAKCLALRNMQYSFLERFSTLNDFYESRRIIRELFRIGGAAPHSG
jgi:hypothetical protein